MRINNTKSIKAACSALIFIMVIGLICLGIAFSKSYNTIETLKADLNDRQAVLSSAQKELSVTQEELNTMQENLSVEVEKSIGLNEELTKAIECIDTMSNELEKANTTIADLKSEEFELIYLGDYKITYYCDELHDHICGGNGMTASGKPTKVGVTAAADWSVLPNGSSIYIEGIGWREIQDVGGSVKGKHIDVLVNTHSEAEDFGVDHEGVWLLVKKKS